MTTKDQERVALAKIKKIVADLGEESYIGTALDGALELAEQNIDDDAAYSCRYYINKTHEADRRVAAIKAEYEADAAKQAERDHDNEARNALLHKCVSDLTDELNSVKESAARLLKSWSDETERASTLEGAINARDQEIITLKAKLYDLLTKEA